MDLIDYLNLKKGETKTRRDIIRNPELSSKAKMIYAMMKAIQEKDLTVTNKELACMLPGTIEEVKQAKKELINAGILRQGVIYD